MLLQLWDLKHEDLKSRLIGPNSHCKPVMSIANKHSYTTLLTTSVLSFNWCFTHNMLLSYSYALAQAQCKTQWVQLMHYYLARCK